jgi:ABC-type bacteriocin/lantibiotic exporter with double-glycine peptidase domain
MTRQETVASPDRLDALGPLLLRSGEATVFLSVVAADGSDGRRTPVVTLRAPALVATRPPPRGWRWVVGPGLDSELDEATLDSDEKLLRDAVVNTAETLGDLLRAAGTLPAESVVRIGSRPTPVPGGHAAMVDQAAWVQPTGGAITLAHAELPAAGAPIGPRLALRGRGDAVCVARSIEEIAVIDLITGVEWLFHLAAARVHTTAAERRGVEVERALSAEADAGEAEAGAVRLLAEQLRARPELVFPPGTDPLVACSMRVLAAKRLEAGIPRDGPDDLEGTAAVRAIAAALGVYVRRVTIAGEWWRAWEEPVLGFRADGTPLALLPSGDRVLAVTAEGAAAAVDATLASGIVDAGFVFNRPIVEERVDRATLGRLATGRHGRTIGWYASWAAIVAAAGLAVPFAAGVVFDSIVPAADRQRLWYLLAALVLVALATLPIQVAMTSARTRWETTAALDVQRGLWGRVLLSPVRLVQRVGAGDLAMRLAALETARDPIDQTVLAVLPSLLSGLLAGLVLFLYDMALAAIVLAGGLLLLGLALVLARDAARAQEEVESATGAVNGFLFQVLVAIPKLRVAAAESRAFLAWAGRFSSAVGQRLMRASGREILLTSMAPTLGSLVLFGGVAIIGPDKLAADMFVAFQTTYNVFLTGVTATVAAVGTALQLGPTVERAVELAQERPEGGRDGRGHGRLRGAVAFAGVTFRYLPGTRPVVDDMSFRIEPGQLVAITGPSGSGKSTIMRLLLGFERAEQGSVLFDDHNLSSLDVSAVRRQLGVVLQDGQLMPGTVRQNLAGMAALSEQAVWELAELVALAEDIRAMPMKLDTVVTLNGGAFSGGQRQRLLIARALATRPRVLLFDEATSALDNVAQRIIMENLAALGMTRIIVAHRLSTIVGADRILVVDRGRIAEDGTFEQLMARGGLFHSLATRQEL